MGRQEDKVKERLQKTHAPRLYLLQLELSTNFLHPDYLIRAVNNFYVYFLDRAHS